MSSGVDERFGFDLLVFMSHTSNFSMLLTSCSPFAGCEYHAVDFTQKVVDICLLFCHTVCMSRFIVKVGRTDGTFRIVVPKSIVQLKKWDNVRYVFLDDSLPDQIILRSFIDEDEAPAVG